LAQAGRQHILCPLSRRGASLQPLQQGSCHIDLGMTEMAAATSEELDSPQAQASVGAAANECHESYYFRHRLQGLVQHAAASHRRCRSAPVLPAAAALIFMVLSEVTRQMAVGSGHCDVHLKDGSSVRVTFPEISPATRLPPERWVWTLGVVGTWAGLLCPSFILGWRVVFRRAPQRVFFCLGRHLLFALLVVGSLGLVGLACVPLQGDVMEMGAVITQQSTFHLACAGFFFLCMLVHGPLVLIWQWRVPAQERVCGQKSLFIKAAAVVVGALSVIPVVPFGLVMLCSSSTCNSRAILLNLGGLTQRCLVFCIALFLASYSLDIMSMQRVRDAELNAPLEHTA